MSAILTGGVYPRKPNDAGNIQVQFYDARSTTEATEPGDKYPAVKEILGFGELPAIQEARMNEQVEEVYDRGVFLGWTLGDDSVDIPEVTFDILMSSGSVAGTTPDTNLDLSEWFELFQADDTYGSPEASALISTNTGSVNIRKEGAATPVAKGLPVSKKTLGMVVLFANGESGKTFGYDFPQVAIVSSSKDSDTSGMFHFTIQILSAFTKTTELKTQTTVS